MGCNNLTYGKDGISLTEQFEGCALSAYQDQVGVWTIGYGHTGQDVRCGLNITQEGAETLLSQDVASAAGCVNKLVTIELSQPEFDALVDFVFNLGSGAFASSTLLKKLNSGDTAAAAAEFDKWDHAGGQIVAGLLRRREAEMTMFNAGASTTQNA
jgi:lysozyme